MKKTLIVLMALVVVVSFAFCSAQAKVKLSAGAGFGFNISTQVSDAQNFDNEKKARNGIVFGGIFSIGFSDYISLQPEIRYSMKGYRKEGPHWIYVDQNNQQQDAGAYKLAVKYDYMEIPVYFKLSIPTGSLFTPDVFFGPVLGLKLGSKYKITTAAGGNANGTIQQQKSIDFGLSFGGGGRFALGPGDIFLNLMYNLGLTTVDGSANASSTKNRCFSIMTGYLFRF